MRSVTDYGTLEADPDCGEGSIRLNPAFYAESLIWNFDVLDDWIKELEQLRNELADLA